MKYHINRSNNLCHYLNKFGWTKAKSNEYSDFSYWDIYNAKPIQSKIKVWDKNYTNIIDNLYSWHSLLEKLSLTDYAPKTIIHWKDHKNHLSETDFSKENFWIMKFVAGTHGKGINIINNYNDYLKWINNPNYKEDTYILQKCIYNSHLIQNKKYILRVYFLTIDSKCYLYHDCLYYTALFPLNNDTEILLELVQ